MLLVLRPNKFIDNLCKNPPNSMDELRKRAKGYIQMEEMSWFRNEAFNVEVPIKLPLPFPPRLGLDRTKHCRYHRSYGHNVKDSWDLKDKIKELMQAEYLAQFMKRPDNHLAGVKP
ncbi:hypothetical protein JHK82_055450 [Glycine max]|nr:hypothetical protein JHK86_055287 [Glycine max]KAG4917997.1 hypothetical protein JHK85_056278 [Glycine max]KAG5074088.1 hypothetical protein JHK84_055319 [Glycine max]KAG5076755.1 hypothetical protein JHK82_055450 [Glycine max]